MNVPSTGGALVTQREVVPEVLIPTEMWSEVFSSEVFSKKILKYQDFINVILTCKTWNKAVGHDKVGASVLQTYGVVAKEGEIWFEILAKVCRSVNHFFVLDLSQSMWHRYQGSGEAKHANPLGYAKEAFKKEAMRVLGSVNRGITAFAFSNNHFTQEIRTEEDIPAFFTQAEANVQSASTVFDKVLPKIVDRHIKQGPNENLPFPRTQSFVHIFSDLDVNLSHIAETLSVLKNCPQISLVLHRAGLIPEAQELIQESFQYHPKVYQKGEKRKFDVIVKDTEENVLNYDARDWQRKPKRRKIG